LIVQRSRFLWLFAAVTAASALVISTGAISAGPAFAAPVSSVQAHHAAAPARVAATPADDTSDATTMTSGSADTASADTVNAAAAESCRTSTNYINNEDILGIILFSFNMSTYWCYNGSIVTYHSTGVNHGITGTGSATGWEWIGDSGIDFSCYVASGSTKNCSGNEEHSTGYFYNDITGQSCSDTLHQWENYKGQFFHSESTTC